MNTKILLAPALAIATLGLGACAENYAVEGGLAGAAAGAAIGTVVGYVSDKNDTCDGYYYDRRYVDDDCRDNYEYSRYF